MEAGKLINTPHKTALALTIGLLKTLALSVCLAASTQVLAATAEDVIGDWKLISHVVNFQGETFDSHQALLSQRPCAANVIYRLGKDKTYRLDAAASGCDERYIKIQEKLYAKTQWKLEGTTITTSATNFAVGQAYTVSIQGNRMVWVGKDGQGTLTYQRK